MRGAGREGQSLWLPYNPISTTIRQLPKTTVTLPAVLCTATPARDGFEFFAKVPDSARSCCVLSQVIEEV